MEMAACLYNRLAAGEKMPAFSVGHLWRMGKQTVCPDMHGKAYAWEGDTSRCRRGRGEADRRTGWEGRYALMTANVWALQKALL